MKRKGERHGSAVAGALMTYPGFVLIGDVRPVPSAALMNTGPGQVFHQGWLAKYARLLRQQDLSR
ncbi:hypothetical protein [Arthrobacter sp. NPDC057013]|uniref:hypothetical protein n=1 Tax=Arthrobacter sp. NPDC057013 TaxID=3345999 RepID=UPI00363A9DEB